MYLEDLRRMINQKEVLTKNDLTDLALMISKNKDLKLESINFSNRGPEMVSGKNKLTLSDNPEAEWFKLEISEFKSATGLRYIENKDNLGLNLKTIYSNLDVNFINGLLMMTVYHEMRHAEQMKIIDESYLYTDPILVKNLLISYLMHTPNMVLLYHDKLYFEYDANINAIYEILKLDINDKLKRYFAYKILLSYTNKPGRIFTSPIDNNKSSFGDTIKCDYYQNQINYVNDNAYSPNNDILLGTRMENGFIENLDNYYQGKTKTFMR